MDYDRTSGYRQQLEKYGETKLLAIKRDYANYNIIPLIPGGRSAQEQIRILEFGPGTGDFATQLYEAFPNCQYTALDIDPAILSRLDHTHPAAKTLLVPDLESFKAQVKGPFDAIIALDVWEHLPKDFILEYTRQSLARLAPGGVFIAQVPNLACPFAFNTIYANDITHCNMFNEISATQLLMLAGAQHSQIQIRPYLFPPINLLWRLRSLIRFPILKLYSLTLFILGLQRVEITTPNLIMAVRTKPDPVPTLT